MRVEVVDGGPERLGARTAVWIAERLWAAVAERGQAHLAVSGGHTPAPMFRALARLPVPWEQVDVWQVDERVAPDGDHDRNATLFMADLVVLAPLASERVHLMPVTDPNLEAAAARYGDALQRACGGVLDVAHLGLGPDGHTASWPPGDAVIDVDDRLVGLSGVYQGRRRMTLTVPAVNAARGVVFQVVGRDKADAVAGLVGRDPSVPAARVTDAAVVIVDPDAAARIRSSSLP